MSLSTVRKEVITGLGMAIVVGATVAHVAGSFLPGSDIAIVNSVVAVLTTVLTALGGNAPTVADKE